MKRIWIIAIVAAIIMSSLTGIGTKVTADDTVPVAKYDALVLENQALKEKIELGKMAEGDRFEMLQAQLLGPVGNDKYSVQPIFLVPSDVSVPEAEIRTDILSALTALKDVQSWYLRETGAASFSIRRSAVISAKQPLGALERFPSSSDFAEVWNYQYPAVLTELDSAGFVRKTKDVYYLVFLYGKTSVNWAGWRYDYGVEMAVMDNVVRLHLNGSEGERRHARGMIAHELGHLFGHLSDVETKEKTIMSLLPNKDAAFAHLFPNVHFNPQEKAFLRTMMAEEE